MRVLSFLILFFGMITSTRVHSQAEPFCTRTQNFRDFLSTHAIGSDPGTLIFHSLVEKKLNAYERDTQTARNLDERRTAALNRFVQRDRDRTGHFATNQLATRMEESNMDLIHFLGRVYLRSFFNLSHLPASEADLALCPDRKCLKRVARLRDQWKELVTTPDCTLDLQSKRSDLRTQDQNFRRAERSVRSRVPKEVPCTDEFLIPIPIVPRRKSHSYAAIYPTYSPTSVTYQIQGLKFQHQNQNLPLSQGTSPEDLCRELGFSGATDLQKWRDFGLPNDKVLNLANHNLTETTGRQWQTIYCSESR